ncbi:sodium-independent sulfate anion transporter-like isoform X2 [Zootermopsis nevadensis]|uniref:sodium-independent sulfate anion transporter-like isoform X2 n=1 Tax=Zootermopsis nevadensis TaxID=136037 RepID=UPI000B8EA6B1|nr:sodium-independent sulfate anion transporter-like isoform X2 [Zootermopsis nevadensis]
MKTSVINMKADGQDPLQSQETSFSSKAADTVTSCIQAEVSEMCTKEFVHRRFPFTKWLPQYNFSTLVQDVLAGLTVSLTLIPQSIAYAEVAGLQPQYGLYASFMSCFVYIFLGSCKDITIGPTAIMGIMTNPFVVENDNPDFAVLLCFLMGCVIVLVGLLRLGFLVEFISLPVIAGFISAAAITIASSQLKSLLGIKGSGNDFLESWENLFNNIQNTQPGDVTLGVCTIILLLIGRKMKDFAGSRQNSSAVRRFLGKTMWIISISRNSIVVIIGMLLAYILESKGFKPFKITGEVEDGFPPFGLPPFTTVSHNQTLNFEDMASKFGTSLLSVPFISILETIAIAKSFSKGKAVDASQELFALGFSNIMSSFVRSFPLAGSFSRTAVNNASGVKTPLGGLMTGAMVLMALGLLTSTFAYIPKATLAGVIISAVIFMVEYEMVPLLWRTKRIDLIPMAVTFIACLGIGLDYGMLLGIGVNLMFILYSSARPKVQVRNLTIEAQEVLLVIPEQGLVFPAAEYIRDAVFRSCLMTESNVIVVIEGTNVHHIDFTVAQNMAMLVDDLEIKNQKIIFWNWKHSAEVVCRGIDAKLSKYFYYEGNMESLLQGLTAERGHNGTGDSTNETNSTSLVTEPSV